MATRTNIQQTFQCDRNWSEMQPAKNGRFCTGCKKEVIDFRNYSRKEFSEHLTKNEHVCGYFKAEQIDTSLISPIKTPKQIRYFAFLSFFAFMISTKTTYSQTKKVTTTEQTIGTNRAPADSSERTYDPAAPKNGSCSAPQHKIFKTHKKVYYWSTQFPFIKGVKRNSQRMGNVRML